MVHVLIFITLLPFGCGDVRCKAQTPAIAVPLVPVLCLETTELLQDVKSPHYSYPDLTLQAHTTTYVHRSMVPPSSLWT